MLLRRAAAILAIAALVLALVPVKSVRAVDVVTSTGGALYASTSANYTRVEKTWYSPNGWRVLKARFKMQGRPYFSGASYTYDTGYLYFMQRGRSDWNEWGRWDWNLTRDFWVDFAASGYDVVALKVAIYTSYSSAGGTAWADVPEVLLQRPPFDPGKPSLGGGSPSHWNVRVSWSAYGNPSGTQYELWRKTLNPDGSVVKDEKIYSGTATEFTTTDQNSGKYYLYRVRAYYDGIWSSFSPETSFWTAPGFSSVAAGAGSISLSWPKVKDGLTYRVWWAAEGCSWQNATTTALSHTLTGLDPGRVYVVCLSPVLSEGGNEWWAGGNRVAPLAHTPGSLNFSGITQTSFQVSWSAGSNRAGVAYEVWMHPSSPFKGNGTFDVVHGEHVGIPTNPNSVGTYLGGGWNAATDYNAARILTAREGNNTFLRFVSDGTGKWAGATSSWSIKAGKWYRVTAKARTSSASPITIWDYAIYTGAFNPQLVWPDLKASDGWRTAYVIFQADADRSGAMCLYGNHGAAGVTVDYDDVVVEEFDSRPPDAAGSWTEYAAPGGGILARVFDSSSWYASKGHPSTHDELMAFFNPANVSFYTATGLPNVDWTSPPSSLQDRFSAEHRGLLYAPVSGTYWFATDSDDASEIEVDGRVVVGWYGGHVPSGDWSHAGSVDLSAGWHVFVYRMEEGVGGQAARAAWKKPGDSAFSVIPRDAFGGFLVGGGPVTFGSLAPGTSYDVMVQALNAELKPSGYSLGTVVTAPPDVSALSGQSGPLDWSNSAGRGWVRLTWQPVQGATGYKVWVFDGNAYRAFDVGSRTYWDSREEKIYPPESVLDSYGDNAVSSDLFRHDRSGLDLRDTPNKLYRKTVGTASDSAHNYWFRVSAYNAFGESNMYANGYMPTLPNRTDTQAPTGSMVINEDQMVAGGPSVVLRITAQDPPQLNYTSDPSDDASGVAQMRFSNDRTNWSDWVAYQETYQWKLDTSTFGKKTVYGQVKDAAGNVSATFSDEIYYYLVDAQAPQVSLLINGGADTTSSAQVQLEVKAQDDLTPATGLQSRFSNDFSSWTAWESYQPYRSWTLPSGDGQKTVYVQVKDQSGNIGTAYARITLKTSGGAVQSAPGVFWSDSGNGGMAYFAGQPYPVVARFVTGTQVVLRLNAPGISYVQYSLDGMRWLPVEPALPQKIFSLPDWEGHKTVYARLPDGTVYVVHFILDRTPPEIQAGWLGGATVAPGGQAVLVIDARDNFTRQQDLQVSLDGGATWRVYASQIAVSLGGSGYRTVVLVVKDLAGNVVQKTLGIFVP